MVASMDFQWTVLLFCFVLFDFPFLFFLVPFPLRSKLVKGDALYLLNCLFSPPFFPCSLNNETCLFEFDLKMVLCKYLYIHSVIGGYIYTINSGF